jgi:hypothetical protein
MASNDELPPAGLSLEPDYITVPGQNYALVSFVGPACRQKNEKLGMKIRGVFATREDASSHVKRLQRSGDNMVDIFLLDLYQWAVIPPDPEGIEDHEFQEKFLQDMMKGYMESQRAAKEHFEDRKKLVMAEGLDKHLLPHERIPKPDAQSIEPIDKLPQFSASVIADDAAPADAGEGSSSSVAQVFEELSK